MGAANAIEGQPPYAFKSLLENNKVLSMLHGANNVLKAMGYTEHGLRHAKIVGKTAGGILDSIGADPHEAELARVAGFLHDIGNVVNRINHPMIGATLAYSILNELGMPPQDIATVLGAIGNHEEQAGQPIHTVSAAVIIADKSDVHYSRVQCPDPAQFDVHDRVNYSVRSSLVHVDRDAGSIMLDLDVDPTHASVMEFFEIFVSRMVMCRTAAVKLGYRFKLQANGTVLE